jgi:hypothetical protein
MNNALKTIILILVFSVGSYLGYNFRQKPVPPALQPPAVAQSQDQAVDCTIERTTKPDGTLRQAYEQSQLPPVSIPPVKKPGHSLEFLAQADSNDLKPFLNVVYGEKLRFLDIDGLKWKLGAGAQPNSSVIRGTAGLSYDW